MSCKAYVYIHIPKTAGSLAKRRITESQLTSTIVEPSFHQQGISSIVGFHPSISLVKQLMPASQRLDVGFVAVVRNPFDRVYSLWKWLNLYGKVGNIEFPSVPNTFENFLSAMADGWYDTCYFMQPQTFYLRGAGDQHIELLRFEEMDNVQTFFEACGVSWSSEKLNAIPSAPFTEVYTEAMADVVRERYSDEFKYLGYSPSLHSVDASDDQYRSGAYGSIGLDPADPADMVPYADVTQEQCIEWLKAKLGEEAVTNVETALQGQLDEQRSPTKAQGVPWAA